MKKGEKEVARASNTDAVFEGVVSADVAYRGGVYWGGERTCRAEPVTADNVESELASGTDATIKDATIEDAATEGDGRDMEAAATEVVEVVEEVNVRQREATMVPAASPETGDVECDVNLRLGQYPKDDISDGENHFYDHPVAAPPSTSYDQKPSHPKSRRSASLSNKDTSRKQKSAEKVWARAVNRRALRM